MGVLHDRVYKHHEITDVEELRQRVDEEWDRLDQEVIDNTIIEWRKQLQLAEDSLNIHSEHYCICSHTE